MPLCLATATVYCCESVQRNVLIVVLFLSVREVKQHMLQANPKFEGKIGFFFRYGYVLRYPAFKALESPTPLRI